MSLRETKKQATREHIAGEAMRLFVARGFEHVTVAEIADAAGVSEKTVYNYFPTKEDIFFDEVPKRLERLLAAVHDRKQGASVFDSLRAMQLHDCGRMCSPQFAHFARAIEDSPALQSKELEVMGHFADVLAEALRAELRVSELDARVAANSIVSVHWQFFRNARREALAGRHGPAAERRLRSELTRAYRLLGDGLATLEA